MKYKNGLPKNFNLLTKEEQIIVLLQMALEYPMTMKYVPLAKLHTIDEEMSNVILKAHDESSKEKNGQEQFNDFLRDCLIFLPLSL